MTAIDTGHGQAADDATILLPLGEASLSIPQSEMVITGQLRSRVRRPRDLLAEARALQALTGLIGVDPRRAVDRALQLAMSLCGADSAGLGLLESSPEGGQRFRWDAIAGPLSSHVGGTTPRDFGACGLCLEARETILVSRPLSVFASIDDAQRPLIEGLVAPLNDADGPVGTLWVAHHEVTKRFDAEDARVAGHLAALMTLALKRRGQETEAETAAVPRSGVDAAPQPRQASANPFVRKLEAYGPLSASDRALLERASADAQPMPARADLISEGDQPGGVFLVMEGMACRYKLRADGRRQITAYLLPGDCCDIDIALLRRMDHGIAAVSRSRVARIPRETIVDLTENHPAIAKALRTATLVDEATLREWLVSNGCRSALERVAHLICELLLRLQVVGLATADACDLPLTQIDLADTTGLSNVHVNRVIQELRRSGLLTLNGRTLRILDLPRLRALAEFRPAYLHLGQLGAEGEAHA